LLWQLQERNKKKNIANAFKTEIKRLEPAIKQVFSLLEKYEKPIFDGYGNAQNSDNYDIYERLKKLQLYSKNGNWYILKRDAYSLNPQISEKLEFFYYNLIEAEECRIKYLDSCPRDRKDEYIDPLNDYIENVIKIMSDINTLLR